MREILVEPGKEPPPSVGGSARDAWLDVVKRRYEAKHDRKLPDKQLLDFESRSLHHLQKPAKKVSSEFSTKDTCPYFREDSIPELREVQAPTPHRRSVLAPTSNFTSSGPVVHSEGSCAQDGPLTSSQLLPEKVPESRRDYTTRQARACHGIV
eukprot:NODE_18282_length_901_cov_1.445736.p2 GENE.NODE_18282_length_901_cov_1.445736~~NODE_18282_length_901_cov_1.445736.p2  ORF type:complete len:153 (+),score=25.86 NODE_18282_length_901_cov_1.445736:296-754(+)